MTISPASGRTLGGTPVTITGTSFTSGRQPFTVAFGVGAPVSAARVDNQTLTATTPAHTAGIVDVIVTGNANQGNAASVTLTNGFTFTRVNPTVTFTGAPANAAYQSTFTVASSTNSSASPVYTSSGACSNVGPTYTMTSGTATCTATVTWSADANYNGAQATQTTAAVKKAASVTPAAASKVYGSVDPALSGALSGFLVADGVSASYSRAAGETVGSYTISAALSPAGVLTNYDITYNTAAFAITKKAASVTPAAASKVYGSADPALSGALSGFLVADGVSASYSRTAGEAVGSYPISATLAPAGVLGNYDITYNTASFDITKKAASVTPAAGQHKTYGDADPALSGSTSGFLAADGVTASYSRTAGETVGSYTISAALSPAGLLSNYDITYNTASFDITKKAASVTPAAGQHKTYGDADPALSGSTSGFLAADGVTASYGRTAGETVGSYPISATLAPAGVLSNYDITYNTAAFAITKKAASVTPAAASKVYGSADPTLSGALSGFLVADGVSASYSRAAGETVGSYPISATLAPAGVLSNYDITYNTASFDITKKASSVTPDAKTTVYGSADPPLSGALSGFLVADGVTASYSRTAGETVGSYTISAALSPAGVLGNYDITYNTASFDITKKAASVTPAAASKVYGSADPALSGALSGFLVADGVSASYSRTAGETVGSYPISATLAPAGVLGNYDITYNTASFDVTKKAASVTPDAKTKVYGSADPTLSGALSGFLVADGVTASYSRTAGEAVGSYPISATLAPAGVLSNYDITYNTAAFAITKKAASVTPAAASKVYGSADPTLSGALSGFLVADGVTASYSRTAGETVGSYPISATLAPAGVLGNYDITYNTASFDIAKKAASVTPAAGQHKTYGDADPALSGSTSGFLAADGVTASYSRTAGETVGSYTISAALSPAGLLSNYDITYNTASFDITKKAASVTAAAGQHKTYGDADPALSGSTSGFLAADGVTASYNRTAGETVGSYPISATLAPAGVLSNYDITYNTAAFAITKKAASVTPAAASQVYGSADPTLSGALSGFLVADGVSASYSRTAGEAVGSYPISATLAPAGVLGNYDITYNTASFDITKKAASVTPAAGQHKTYGDADPALSGSTSGFLAADGVTASYSRTAGETVGSYTI